MTGLITAGLLTVAGSCDSAQADDMVWWLFALAFGVMAWGSLMVWIATRPVRPMPKTPHPKEDHHGED